MHSCCSCTVKTHSIFLQCWDPGKGAAARGKEVPVGGDGWDDRWRMMDDGWCRGGRRGGWRRRRWCSVGTPEGGSVVMVQAVMWDAAGGAVVDGAAVGGAVLVRQRVAPW